MSNAEALAPTAKRSGDLWIAVGVVVCLALGAGFTYWVSAKSNVPPPPTKRAARGELLLGPAPATTAASAAPTNAAATESNNAALPMGPLASAVSNADTYLPVAFDTLSGFYYDDAAANAAASGKTESLLGRPTDQIPAPVRALSGKKVAVQGYMSPIKVEKGAVRSFYLVKDQSLCCFGRFPRMNEWIMVNVAGSRGVKHANDRVVTVLGTLDVGEEVVKGSVYSIYRMSAEEVSGAAP